MTFPGIDNGPVYKNISCRAGAIQWEEDLFSQEDDLIEGLWPTCGEFECVNFVHGHTLYMYTVFTQYSVAITARFQTAH